MEQLVAEPLQACGVGEGKLEGLWGDNTRFDTGLDETAFKSSFPGIRKGQMQHFLGLHQGAGTKPQCHKSPKTRLADLCSLLTSMMATYMDMDLQAPKMPQTGQQLSGKWKVVTGKQLHKYLIMCF